MSCYSSDSIAALLEAGILEVGRRKLAPHLNGVDSMSPASYS